MSSILSCDFSTCFTIRYSREINAKDVAAMMMLVKVARFANDPSHRDNLVDICGYAALIERCDESEAE